MTQPCAPVLLPWDSAFFGVRIGSLPYGCGSDEHVAAAVAWSDSMRVDCLYALVDADDEGARAVLEHHGFRCVDARLTLEREIISGVAAADARVRRASAADQHALECLARVSHRNTRFYKDGRFDRARCDELYAIWIAQALTQPGTAAFVADDGAGVGGYVSVHIDASEGRIGLVAVAAAAQRRGLGEAMMAHAIAYVAAHGRSLVTVVTQGDTERAVRFYRKCGFAPRARQFRYHRWREGASSPA